MSKEEGKKGGDSPPFPKGKTRDIVSKFAGVSSNTLAKMEKVAQAAKEKPEQFSKLLQKVDADKISVNAAYIQVMRAEKHIETPVLPVGEFDVIYADPPWEYEFCLEGDSEEKYASMDTDNICQLQVPSAKDSILFLWATNPKLEDALKVLNAWGFKYTTNLVWVKQKAFGLGYYSMAKHELLLIGKKGNIPPPNAENRPASAIVLDRNGHSEKPLEFYGIIEKMYPNRKYLELFSRNIREGWTMWGNEVGKNQSVV